MVQGLGLRVELGVGLGAAPLALHARHATKHRSHKTKQR